MIADGFDITIDNRKGPAMQMSGKCDGVEVEVGKPDFYRVKIASLDTVNKKAVLLARSTVADLASVRASQLRYLHFCDVPAQIPPTMEGTLHEARAERLFPGEGMLDLLGRLSAMPANIPISIEAPTHTLARSVPDVERARRALAATQRVLAQFDSAKVPA